MVEVKKLIEVFFRRNPGNKILNQGSCFIKLVIDNKLQ